MSDSTRSTRRIYDVRTGMVAAVTGSFAYGVTVVIGRDLAQSGFTPAVGLGIRFGIAAAVLLAVLAASRRPLLPAPGERVAAFLFGAVGYAIESTFFYLGLARGTAAAVALLFYTYPAVVAVVEAVLQRHPPRRSVLAALALTVTGTAILSAAGQRLSITGAGIACSLASAVAVAGYVLAAARTMRRTDSLTSAAWVALGASVALLSGAAVQRHTALPHGHRLEVAGYGVATAVAFVMLFRSLRALGPSRTSVVMTLEAFFAAVLAAVFLGERLSPVLALGGGANLAGAVIVALAKDVVPADVPAGP